MGLNIGYGLARLLDAQQRYTQNSRTPISMRFRNFVPPTNELYAQLGYTITPVAGAAGTTDVKIDPPPSTRLISMHNIGMSNGRLRFGARDFIVSAGFVTAQQQALDLATPDELWYCPQFIGLVGYGSLWTVETVAPEELGGIAVLWSVVCNANELR